MLSLFLSLVSYFGIVRRLGIKDFHGELNLTTSDTSELSTCLFIFRNMLTSMKPTRREYRVGNDITYTTNITFQPAKWSLVSKERQHDMRQTWHQLPLRLHAPPLTSLLRLYFCLKIECPKDMNLRLGHRIWSQFRLSNQLVRRGCDKMDEIVIRVFGRLVAGSISLAGGEEPQVVLDFFSLIKPLATISTNLIMELQM